MTHETSDTPPASGRTMRRGMRMSIAGFIRNNRYPRDYGVFEHDDGRPMTPAEALAHLTTEQAKGHTVIPCSGECGNPCKHADQGCTGFDFKGGGCPGYYITDDAQEAAHG